MTNISDLMNYLKTKFKIIKFELEGCPEKVIHLIHLIQLISK